MENRYLELYANAELQRYTNKQLTEENEIIKYIPKIKNVSISPNPSNAKAQIKIILPVEDEKTYFYPEIRYCGEIHAGQQIGVI